jgi:hypothetical protein
LDLGALTFLIFDGVPSKITSRAPKGATVSNPSIFHLTLLADPMLYASQFHRKLCVFVLFLLLYTRAATVLRLFGVDEERRCSTSITRRR